MANNDNNNRNREKHLFYLNELSDYKVASDDPDVRGWKVKDVDNRVIGEVDTLLVNKNTERVVYLSVEVDKSILEANHDPYRSSASEGVHEFVNKKGEEHLIIPIGLVKLNEDDKFIYTDKVNHRTFAETKRTKKGANIDREYEEVVLASYNRGNTASDTPKKDESRQSQFEKDPATKKSHHQETDLRDSDVSRNEPAKPEKAGENSKIKDDHNSSNTKKTSISNEKEKGSTPDTSQSKAGATSHKRDASEDDDFYNKKEFDDKNYRKRK